jgi:eukaryotic-like serine/threonine-protein kinase
MLNPQQWTEVEDLFVRAAQVSSHERADFLDRESADADVRAEVRSLLDFSSDGLATASAAIQSIAASVVGGADGPLAGRWLGPYRITGLIGQGGMGAVYGAVREDDQFHKRVAIKLIPRVLAAPGAVARFRSERQILADLEHQNIARLLDGGTSEGIPYIVMEYVEGVPITAYVRAHALPVPDRLRLMQSVCDAVLYAHQNLVIHRDLKPANILVTADGTVKLLDFGLAKLIDPTRAGPAVTSRMMMMTPEYASPEQIQGAQVTTASDVYSLGVVLYEMLTGERPYQVTSTNLQELERQVLSTEPPRPSSLGTIPPRTRRRLAGDLDNIVLKALHKDVARRYGTVEQFAEDIRRHLQGLPVLARPDSVTYRVGKFVGRHRLAVTGAAALLLLLVSGAIAILWEAHQADLQRQRAEQRVGQLVELANRTLFDVHGAIERLPGATAARKKIVATTLQYLDQLARDTGDDARVQLALATAYARLADIQGNPSLPSLGDWTSAFATYHKAVKILDALHARDPRNPVFMLRRAQVSRGLSYSLVMFGKRDEASAETARGIALAEAFLKIEPANLEGRKLEAQLQLDRLAILLEKDPAAVEKDCLRLLPKYTSLASQYPDDPDALVALAGARTTLGVTASLQNRPPDALHDFQQAAELLETADRLRPNDVLVQRSLLRDYGHIAQALGHANAAPAEVERYIQKGADMAEALRVADASDFMARVDVVTFYLRTGLRKVPEAQIPEALRMLGKAQTTLDGIISATPNPLRFQFEMVMIYENEGAQWKRLRRYQEALRHYRSALDLDGRLAPAMPGPYSDAFLFSDAADVCELLAILGERQESTELAAKAAATAQHLLPRQAVDVAEGLKQVGDAMRMLARKPGPDGHAVADFQAAASYYSQAQKVWAGLPDAQRKPEEPQIQAAAQALVECRRQLSGR